MEATTISTPADYRTEWASKREREWVERNLKIAHDLAQGRLTREHAAVMLAQSTAQLVFGRQNVDPAAIRGLAAQFEKDLIPLDGS